MNEDIECLRRLARACEHAQRTGHLGYWQWDIATDRVEWSDELYEIYGVPRDTFGASYGAYMALVHPGDRERVCATIEHARTTKEALSFDERIIRPDGTVRHLHCWATFESDEAGAVRSMFGTCLDATELLQANEERAQLMELVEHTTDLIGIAELDGRIRYLNTAGRRMVGFESLAEASTKRVGDLLTPEGMKHSLEVETGERIETMATSFVLRDSATGEPRWVATAQRDVTARRALEIRLQHAQRIEAVGRFAAGIAHDFNNLLTVIIALSGLLRADRSMSPKAGEELAEIEAAAQRGATLTRQLLAFSRKQVRQPRVLELDDLVKEAAKLLSRLLPANLDLQLSLAADGARVRADPGQLEQVLLNLVVNARDAMPKGGQIAIETRAVDGRVVFEVQDHGAGMTPEVSARAFEPYFTTKEVASRRQCSLRGDAAPCHGHGDRASPSPALPGRHTAPTLTPTDSRIARCGRFSSHF